MTKWLPSGNKILVRVTPVEKRTASGIIIHETTTERAEMAQMDGTVEALGPLAYRDQMVKMVVPNDNGIGFHEEEKAVPWVAVGDRVKFSKFAGYLHEEDGVKYRVMHDLDVIMVYKQGEAQ